MNRHSEMIKLYAKQLRLPSVVRYEEVLREASTTRWDYEAFLEAVLAAEVAQRQENQRRRRVKTARFPQLKTLDSFEFTRLPHLSQARVYQLARCGYIQERSNLCLIGNPGTGKTHLSIALGVEACQRGLDVRFFTANGLITELREAQHELRLSRLERQLLRVDLLIIDELSYVTFPREASELLFNIISARTERGSMIISSNLEFSRWPELFEDQRLTAALVDRLTFKSVILNMNGESYRFQQRLAQETESEVDHVQMSTSGSPSPEQPGSLSD